MLDMGKTQLERLATLETKIDSVFTEVSEVKTAIKDVTGTINSNLERLRHTCNEEMSLMDVRITRLEGMGWTITKKVGAYGAGIVSAVIIYLVIHWLTGLV